MKDKTQPHLRLSLDALAVQSVIQPGEIILSLRELAYRTFGKKGNVEIVRIARAILLLKKAGRVLVEMNGRAIVSIKSLDTDRIGWQTQAIMHRMVASATAGL